MVLRRCFAEGCSGNQVGESGLDTGHYNFSATANGTGVPAITAESAALGRIASNTRVKTSS